MPLDCRGALMRVAFAFSLIAATPALAQVACIQPGAPQIIFTPPGNVAVGQTYAIVWSDATELGADGYYVIERATNASFQTIFDSQESLSTSASFTSASEGTFFHRVQAFAGCDPRKASAYSSTRQVNIVAGRPNIVITVQPKPVIVAVGESVTAQIATLIIENIGKATVQVSAPSAPINSPNFFTVTDPEGELATGTLTVAPRQPRRLEIRFLSTVSTSTPASFQGFVFLVGQPEPLAVTPYAFVNLKVGASGTATPVFRFGALPTEYVFFPGYPTTQPDADRAPVVVQIENPGDTPMELGGEIGPEVWLTPKTGWNASAIPPRQTVDVELRVDRTKVPTGSALPRYTYFTVRSRNGQSARLLVQDNDVPEQDTGRRQLDPAVRSYIAPQVVSQNTAAGRAGSRLRLSNVGGAALTADVFFTPTNTDGSSSAVRKAGIIVPPNDVVTLTDPLSQIFGLNPPATGQMEVRGPADKVTFLTVNADVFAPAAGGGAYGFTVPVLQRGEGARIAAPHKLLGVTGAPEVRSSVVLVETSGEGVAGGTLQLFAEDGSKRGELPFSLLRYGHTEITDVLARLGATTGITSGRFDVAVTTGGGSVVALLILLDAQKNGGAALVSQKAVLTEAGAGKNAVALATPRIYIIPGVVNGNPASLGTFKLGTVITLAAPANVGRAFRLFLSDALKPPGLGVSLTIQLAAGRTLDSTLQQIFSLSGNAYGTVTIETMSDTLVSARLTSAVDASAAPFTASALPVITNLSTALTAFRPSMRRPVYADGLEQSTDGSRGRRWDLLLSETSGAPASVTVRLYESGNRTAPIAEQLITLAANEQKRLSSVFAAMGLDTDDRRKDRTNVQVMVVPESGNGTVVSVAQANDNRTGDIASLLLTPSGGVPPTVNRAVAVLPKPGSKRRAVRR